MKKIEPFKKKNDMYIEMIRHVLDSEHYYHLAIQNHGSLEVFNSPFEKQPFFTVIAELKFAEPFRNHFLETIKSFSEEDLTNIVTGKRPITV